MSPPVLFWEECLSEYQPCPRQPARAGFLREDPAAGASQRRRRGAAIGRGTRTPPAAEDDPQRAWASNLAVAPSTAVWWRGAAVRRGQRHRAGS